ncbi:glutamine--fructose-6-phosphate transaminase (isomerizing) [Aurantimonas sp. C2-6-R+9]|uniref:glutamine--fructose-6-phosphate transaminase (isomerizing) n=1 Tax=unclassified Aurantimonas TaxID=2638230 RepID=UPI002E199CFE|nr:MULTISPECIES: glutamine--fructose-6-phosphate transaminase (isomerizing) [unclassified Aurantimonas]MEC5290232.1 glutamine--fructose-6-phosphate transaminase (isomerizing) [Aurantimonas sp. C2-3-R2]MEC5380343.1 glutamine--fructose-6-phosphate transaminase (isomerizing) [Aurantimonas sp. C2-6-R+9]MEC5411296.1 glutamine--fructose-6-phosphate transaminase (isomerizing) [Aurantimonas sp. C2-4-R8]
MCGIIGIISREPVADRLVDALKRLEYRGYDSAGVATLEAGVLTRRRAEGKLVNLAKRLDDAPLNGTIGIGHTRWATHGAATEPNAHPHATEALAVVHNGIIENYRDLKAELEAEGVTFESQTDTETIAHLVTRELKRGLSPKDAVHAVLGRLEGAFSLGFLFNGNEDILIGARRGSPLAVGEGEGEMFLGSDAIALSPFTDTVRYLEEGDFVVLTHDGVDIFDAHARPVTREIRHSAGKAFYVDKGNHRHFMQKEIYEQPEVLSHTLGAFVDMTTGRTRIPNGQSLDFSKVNRMALSACGTGYYAALVGRYYFERYARIPCDLDVASEFRYRESPLDDVDLALFVSQSGETADTLASLRYAKAEGLQTAAVVNVLESTIARESDFVLPTLAGPEIGVASTKAFTCQLMALAALAIKAGVDRGVISPERELELTRILAEAPRLTNEAIQLEDRIEVLSRNMATKRHALFLGRGFSFPLAMEGALKLKEISYIHAEGYAAGELKHGPIALIDETMPVVVIAPHDRSFEKTVSNMQEVAARGGEIILITDVKGAASGAVEGAEMIVLPDMPEILTPIVYAIPLQLLAYHTAIQMGTDVDQPRNLAKSVTVE